MTMMTSWYIVDGGGCYSKKVCVLVSAGSDTCLVSFLRDIHWRFCMGRRSLVGFWDTWF